MCAIAIREFAPAPDASPPVGVGRNRPGDPSARVGTGSPAVVIASKMSRCGTAWLRPAGIAGRKVDQGAMPEYIGHNEPRMAFGAVSFHYVSVQAEWRCLP